MQKILVIEDEQTLLHGIVELLGYNDFDVYTASNGEQGFQMAVQGQPDVILCDVMLPRMTGFEVLAAVRDCPDIAATPFIFTTALSDRTSMREGMARGADDYLTKPFSAEELLGVIEARMTHHRRIMARSEGQMEEVKQRLARVVAHELRTPLLSVHMSLELISRQMGQLSPTEMQDLLDTANAGSKRLAHRVEQVVFLTQLENDMLSAGIIQSSGIPIVIGDLLMTTVNLARRFAFQPPPNVQIIPTYHDPDAQIVCNPPALKHALAEVIANAIVFSPENGTVQIDQWRAKDGVWISIVDRGCGIAPERIDQAMRSFQQLDRDRREQQGFGMGLYLAQRIIEAHGGQFELRSVVGKGTQVTMRLPGTP